MSRSRSQQPPPEPDDPEVESSPSKRSLEDFDPDASWIFTADVIGGDLEELTALARAAREERAARRAEAKRAEAERDEETSEEDRKPRRRRRKRSSEQRREDSLPKIPARILERDEHPISRKSISKSALKVLYRLHRAKFKSYLVGGGVRDLMLGRRPKDFDVTTDARPEQLRRTFRNARIIGRRFRLAHILFHDGVVEVATFRRTPDPSEQKGGPDDLLITSDNTYGTPREDAFRRDFTINALFYNVADFTVVDYVGGIEDLEQGLVRVIGDPNVRFQEDPVRMMRACEFAGRLDFDIEEETQRGIREERKELLRGAPPRLADELTQLLCSGHATASMQWMLDLGLLEVLLPEALAMVESDVEGAGDFSRLLPTLDRMIRDRREIPDAVLIAAVLLPQILLYRCEEEIEEGRPLSVMEYRELIHEIFDSFLERFAIPNQKKSEVVHCLEGFHRMCGGHWTASKRTRIASKSYFPHAYLLFEIIVVATGDGFDELEQWKAVARHPRRRDPHGESPRRRRRGRRR